MTVRVVFCSTPDGVLKLGLGAPRIIGAGIRLKKEVEPFVRVVDNIRVRNETAPKFYDPCRVPFEIASPIFGVGLAFHHCRDQFSWGAGR